MLKVVTVFVPTGPWLALLPGGHAGVVPRKVIQPDHGDQQVYVSMAIGAIGDQSGEGAAVEQVRRDYSIWVYNRGLRHHKVLALAQLWRTADELFEQLMGEGRRIPRWQDVRTAAFAQGNQVAIILAPVIKADDAGLRIKRDPGSTDGQVTVLYAPLPKRKQLRGKVPQAVQVEWTNQGVFPGMREGHDPWDTAGGSYSAVLMDDGSIIGPLYISIFARLPRWTDTVDCRKQARSIHSLRGELNLLVSAHELGEARRVAAAGLRPGQQGARRKERPGGSANH